MFIALESTSQEIKTAVAGVKTDVANVDTKVDEVKTDSTTILNHIGTSSNGKTVFQNIETISGQLGGSKIFKASDEVIKAMIDATVTTKGKNGVYIKSDEEIVYLIF